MASKWIVVGISGATCSGKTTLAKNLQEVLPGSVAICQDDYFHPVDSPLHVKVESLGHLNWEIMSALDMITMRSDIHFILSQDPASVTLPTKAKRSAIGDACASRSFPQLNYPNILILEGFLLLNDPDLRNLCDMSYFLTLSREECWNRRRVRVYDPPDIPGYFDLVVWPEYEKHRDLVICEHNITIFDESNSFECTKSHILKDIHDLVASRFRVK